MEKNGTNGNGSKQFKIAMIGVGLQILTMIIASVFFVSHVAETTKSLEDAMSRDRVDQTARLNDIKQNQYTMQEAVIELNGKMNEHLGETGSREKLVDYQLNDHNRRIIKLEQTVSIEDALKATDKAKAR